MDSPPSTDSTDDNIIEDRNLQRRSLQKLQTSSESDNEENQRPSKKQKKDINISISNVNHSETKNRNVNLNINIEDENNSNSNIQNKISEENVDEHFESNQSNFENTDNGWKQVSIESSSDTDSGSGESCELDIIVPIKLLQNKNDEIKEKKKNDDDGENFFVPVKSTKTPLVVAKKPLSENLQISKENIDKTSERHKSNSEQSKSENEDEDCIVLSDNDAHVETTKNVEVDSKQTSKQSENKIKSNKQKKRKLYIENFNESDDKSPYEEENSNSTYIPKRNDETFTGRRFPNIEEESVNKEPLVTKTTNLTRKFHSDSESFVEGHTFREEVPVGNPSKKTKLYSVLEKSSAERCLELSPSTHKRYEAIHDYNSMKNYSKSQIFNRMKCEHSCSCSNQVSSPKSLKLKRQKIFKHMLKKRERQIKFEFAKKVKKALCQAFEYLDCSSEDESESLSLSSDDSSNSEHMRKLNKHRYYNSKVNQEKLETKSKLKEMEKEVEYWKTLSKTRREIISPEELRMRKLEKELNYWKNVASSSNRGQQSNFSIARSSTPMNYNDREQNERRKMAPPESRRLSRASSVDTLVSRNEHQIRHTSSSPSYRNERRTIRSETPVKSTRYESGTRHRSVRPTHDGKRDHVSPTFSFRHDKKIVSSNDPNHRSKYNTEMKSKSIRCVSPSLSYAIEESIDKNTKSGPSRYASSVVSIQSYLPSISREMKSSRRRRDEWNPTNILNETSEQSFQSIRPIFNETSNRTTRDNDYSINKIPSHPTSVLFRTKFTEKEKCQIIQYLIDHSERIELIKGVSFWIQMAHDLNTHRSWHSIKNNFFKNIMKNLEKYDMPNSVRNKIISIAKDYM